MTTAAQERFMSDAADMAAMVFESGMWWFYRNTLSKREARAVAVGGINYNVASFTLKIAEKVFDAGWRLASETEEVPLR